jgi:hypothetical protein
VLPLVDATLDRVAAMPAGTVDVSVGGEWSFAQTLRHLIMATGLWLSRTVMGIEQPFHPIGQPHGSAGDDGLDMSLFTTVTPPYAEVLEVRACRVAMVRDFLAAVTQAAWSLCLGRWSTEQAARAAQHARQVAGTVGPLVVAAPTTGPRGASRR